MALPIRGRQRIIIRTATQWTADDAVIPLGWWAVSYTGTTLNKLVIGNGASAFSALSDQLGGGGGNHAPKSAQYVTLAHTGALTHERVLTAGTGISITDGGANGHVTIAATGGSTRSYFPGGWG